MLDPFLPLFTVPPSRIEEGEKVLIWRSWIDARRAEAGRSSHVVEAPCVALVLQVSGRAAIIWEEILVADMLVSIKYGVGENLLQWSVKLWRGRTNLYGGEIVRRADCTLRLRECEG